MIGNKAIRKFAGRWSSIQKHGHNFDYILLGKVSVFFNKWATALIIH